MATSKNLIDVLKKDLAKARPAYRRMTSKNIVEELVEDIHTQLKAGARLDDVYEIISNKLTDDTKMSLSTFKRYWREARDGAGLSKIKNSGRKKREKQPLSQHSKGISNISKNNLDTTLKRDIKDTSGDFREDPVDI